MKCIKIIRGKVFSEIFPKDTSYYSELSDILSVESIPPKQLFFIKKNKPHLKGWDGRYRFVTWPALTFPGGLTDYLLERLDKKEWNVSFTDKTSHLVLSDEVIDSLSENFLSNDFTYRDYQLSIIKNVIRAKRCIIPAATNAGKTEIFIGLCKVILNYAKQDKEFKKEYPKPRVLYLLSGVDLLKQTIQRFSERCPELSVGGYGDKLEQLDKDIIVASSTMIYSRLKKEKYQKILLSFLNSCVLFIGDEYHRGSSKSWITIASQTQAVYRFGGSGTALGSKKTDEESNLKRLSMTGNPIDGITNKFMVDNKYSAKPTILFHDLKSYDGDYDGLIYGYIDNSKALWYNGYDFENVTYKCKEELILTDVKGTPRINPITKKPRTKKTGKSVIELEDGTVKSVSPSTLLNKEHAYDFCVCIFEPRNQLILADVEKEIHEKHKILISVEKTAHGKYLENLLTDNDINSKFLYGGSSSAERSEGIKNLKKGTIDVIIASSIFNEGIDLPEFRVIINAAGGKSHIKLIQKTGRGLRKKDKDNTLKMIDFVDSQNIYTLEHSAGRLEEYENQDFLIEYL